MLVETSAREGGRRAGAPREEEKGLKKRKRTPTDAVESKREPQNVARVSADARFSRLLSCGFLVNTLQ